MAWVEISQAAFMMGISERTIRNWIKSGKMNAKTENGQRLVEIPDEEFRAGAASSSSSFEEGGAFGGDAAEEGQPLDTQKRLEIALLECGRVKGTLASQERIMETLSSNISELSAKLQRSQNNTWKLVVLCVATALIALAVYFAASSYYYKQINDIKDLHRSELDVRSAEYMQKADTMRKEMDESRGEYEKKREEAFRSLVEKLEKDNQAQLEEKRKQYDEFMKEKTADLDKAKAELRDLRDKMDAGRDEQAKLQQQTQALEREKADLQKRLDEKARLEEAHDKMKQQYRELESELIEARRRIRELEAQVKPR